MGNEMKDMNDKKELLLYLPKVDVVLNDSRILEIKDISRKSVVDSIREVLDSFRKGILEGTIDYIDYDEIVYRIISKIKYKNSMNLKRVINATGTVLHTNLGRAVLSKKVMDEVIKTSTRYSNLEFDLESGNRGSRYSHVEDLICKITGAEAALVVNNNAAAVLLVLSTLSKDREAIVSRGQLVEIGGSFRVPAVMEQSGAKLREVGTTNRTNFSDYESAINENTGVILKVHQSNYKILGFTEEVAIDKLVELGKKYSLPVVEDIGSGVLIDLSKYGLSYEPTVQESIKRGIDVVTFSGDKLLGGPQAGIIIGKKKYVEMMKKNQLNRALRIDKMTLAALEATFKLYIDEEKALKEIPVLNMLNTKADEIKKRANKLARLLKNSLQSYVLVEVKEDFSQVGGGAMPLENLETYTVQLKPLENKVQDVEKSLRMMEIPIITRINKDKLVFDLRTIFDDELSIIRDSLVKIFGSDK
ncbi:selenocysteine synthase [Fervidicella metallireducens AeB]|uniref:L-seryl-tRNA(Sec) selenium transferase n=1 Tax=Fervidicella metallireducens AeB TaxID=1403537 RepID=A0A017RX38_9CLOT|nr:L-seryl-tRNA(Sec) selenium transferase [Fervidicella metallireducens]EYE88485.1 selenocysteine synthase [Fervidicella metallireducens AeB]